MRLESPCSARSTAWPISCGMSENTRRLADVTRAFVDRTAIDWGALLHRTSDEVERDLTRNLHLLNRIRG
jgi:hypothetical protein